MTKEKTINGLFFEGFHVKPKPITLRVTVDERGKSLSLSDDETVLLQIGLEAVKEIIQPVGEWEIAPKQRPETKGMKCGDCVDFPRCDGYVDADCEFAEKCGLFKSRKDKTWKAIKEQ